jgi:hypothetical protein
MGLTRTQMDAELQALYDQIPRIPDCDGQCWMSCGPIEMADRERQRIRRAGVRISPWQQAIRQAGKYCEALTEGKRCAVYEMRPVLCRIWGAVEGMECPFGCVPEGGYLSEADGYRLIMESMRIGGGSRALPLEADADELASRMTTGSMRPHVERIRARGRVADLQHAQEAETVPPAFRRAAR